MHDPMKPELTFCSEIQRPASRFGPDSPADCMEVLPAGSTMLDAGFFLSPATCPLPAHPHRDRPLIPERSPGAAGGLLAAPRGRGRCRGAPRAPPPVIQQTRRVKMKALCCCNLRPCLHLPSIPPTTRGTREGGGGGGGAGEWRRSVGC